MREINESTSKKALKKELLIEIKNAILELDVAQHNYNDATGELIDYYSYKIKAAQSKCDYLLRLAKDINVS